MDDDTPSMDKWRTEHARTPDTDSTPRSEAASHAGRQLFEEALGTQAIARLNQEAASLSTDRRRAFGAAIAEELDMEIAPSRLSIQQELQEQSDGPPQVRTTEVETRRRAALLDQLDTSRLADLAVSVGLPSAQ